MTIPLRDNGDISCYAACYWIDYDFWCRLTFASWNALKNESRKCSARNSTKFYLIIQPCNAQPHISLHHPLKQSSRESTDLNISSIPFFAFISISPILFSCVNNAASNQHECKRCCYCVRTTNCLRNEMKRRLLSET